MINLLITCHHSGFVNKGTISESRDSLNAPPRLYIVVSFLGPAPRLGRDYVSQLGISALNSGGKEKRIRLETALHVKRLSKDAILPTRASPQAAGYDLYSAADVSVPAQGKVIVPTDLAMAIPDGCYGRIAPRSSMAWKHHIDVGAGVIDADYRGNVGVVLFNLAQKPYEVRKGDRIAQLVLERILTPEVMETEELPKSDRGGGGFGSTGI